MKPQDAIVFTIDHPMYDDPVTCLYLDGWAVDHYGPNQGAPQGWDGYILNLKGMDMNMRRQVADALLNKAEIPRMPPVCSEGVLGCSNGEFCDTHYGPSPETTP